MIHEMDSEYYESCSESLLQGGSGRMIAAERDARVPLSNKMGSAWDVAHAALFLASEEAGFITGAALPVDGGE